MLDKMKKAACWVTDWIGWAFVELANIVFGNWDKGIRYRFGSLLYSIGCWFYGLFGPPTPWMDER